MHFLCSSVLWWWLTLMDYLKAWNKIFVYSTQMPSKSLHIYVPVKVMQPSHCSQTIYLKTCIQVIHSWSDSHSARTAMSRMAGNLTQTCNTWWWLLADRIERWLLLGRTLVLFCMLFWIRHHQREVLESTGEELELLHHFRYESFVIGTHNVAGHWEDMLTLHTGCWAGQKEHSTRAKASHTLLLLEQ